MAPAEPDFRRFIAAPRFDRPIVFLYGNDDALIGPAARSILTALKRAAPGELAVNSVSAADIAADPAMLFDMFGVTSLFGGRAALAVGDITERQAALFIDFLAGLPDRLDTSGERVLLASSSALKAKSKLVAAFRAHPLVRALSCYDVSLDRAGLRRVLAEQGVAQCDDDALQLLESLSRGLDPQRFAMLLEKLGLLAGDQPIRRADVVLCEDGGGQFEADLALLLLAGDRAGLAALYTARINESGDAAGLLPMLGRILTDLLAGQRAKTGAAPKRHLFWKTEEALTSASRRLPDLAERLERAAIDLHQVERRSRGVDSMGDAEIERLLLRVGGLFSTRTASRK